MSEGATIYTCWEEQSDSEEGDIFSKKGDTVGITLGDNPAEHCFLLRDLVPIKFFKWFMTL